MFPKTWDLTISPATWQTLFPVHDAWFGLSQQWNKRNKQNNVNPCLKKKKKLLQFLLQCHPKVIIWYGLSESEGSVQWPQLKLLCYKFSLKPSKAHVVPNPPPPPPPPQHFTVAREEPEQQSRSSRQEWNEPELFVRSKLGLSSTTDAYPPPPPHPLPSDRLETATFSAPTGNGEFVLPPTKIYIFWASLPFIDMNFNLRYDEECASWIGSILRVKESFLNYPCLECWRLGLCDRSPS